MASLLILGLAACGDDAATEPDPPPWSITYRASNTTAEAVIVALSGPAADGVTALEVAVPAGEAVELLSHEAAAAPAVEDDFWCVSVLRGEDRSLVRQLCPVTGDQWQVDDPGAREAVYLLVITPADLEPIEDTCPRLAGVVFASETGQVIVGATVAYHGPDDFHVTTSTSGRYLFYLPEGPLQGTMEVSAEGRLPVEQTLPDGVFGNSSGLYRLDFGLMMAGP
jgi:hypothetical protein